MPGQARFYIDVPLELLENTEQVLNSLGVQFCSIENMVPLHNELILDGIFTGAEGGYARRKINNKLRDQGHPRLINQQFYRMQPEARYAFLLMATLDMCWNSEYKPDILELSTAKVDEFLDKYPEAETAHPDDEDDDDEDDEDDNDQDSEYHR